MWVFQSLSLSLCLINYSLHECSISTYYIYTHVVYTVQQKHVPYHLVSIQALCLSQSTLLNSTLLYPTLLDSTLLYGLKVRIISEVSQLSFLLIRYTLLINTCITLHAFAFICIHSQCPVWHHINYNMIPENSVTVYIFPSKTQQIKAVTFNLQYLEMF